jgi:hypothetical protein
MSNPFITSVVKPSPDWAEHVPIQLDHSGVMPLYPARYFDAIPEIPLRIWCHVHARYGLITEELVLWLKDFIGDRSAIEIGSGHGDLAYHAHIPATDNRMQEWKDIREFYALTRQPTIKYAPFVDEVDALDAVFRYKPEVVIGSWVTHRIPADEPSPEFGGNHYGVREPEILETGVTYVFIGSEAIHGKKPILNRPHQTYRPPFLRSRSTRRDDVIYVWNQ